MKKIIWAFWDTSVLPNLVQKCIHSWRVHLPDWEIIIFSTKTMEPYISLDELPSSFSELSSPFKSDLLRLLLLKKYSGVWLDSSLFMLDNFDWLFDHIERKQITHFTGFKLRRKKYFESWFIAVPTVQDPMISKWYTMLKDVAALHPRYTDHECYARKNYTSSPSYFMVYQVYAYLVDTDSSFQKAHKEGAFLEAEVNMASWLIGIPRINSLVEKYSDSKLSSKTVSSKPTNSNRKVYKIIHINRIFYTYQTSLVVGIVLAVACLILVILSKKPRA